jgi:hypothetical protein
MNNFMDRIRSDLTHGYHPKKDDLLKLWLAVTGEEIARRVACRACEAEGQRGEEPCPECRGSGFLPAWMMQ